MTYISSQMATGLATCIASFRSACEPVPVRVRGWRRLRPRDMVGGRLEAVEAALAAFSAEWPEAAGSISSVDLVPEVRSSCGSSGLLAGAQTSVFLGEVSSRLQLAHVLFTDPDFELDLQSWCAQGDVMCSSLEGLVWHEFGHVLLQSLVVRADPRARSAEAGAALVVTEALGSFTTVSATLAAVRLSRRARMSREEFVAEAVSDFGVLGHRADPVSVAVVMTLAELYHS